MNRGRIGLKLGFGALCVAAAAACTGTPEPAPTTLSASPLPVPSAPPAVLDRLPAVIEDLTTRPGEISLLQVTRDHVAARIHEGDQTRHELLVQNYDQGNPPVDIGRNDEFPAPTSTLDSASIVSEVETLASRCPGEYFEVTIIFLGETTRFATLKCQPDAADKISVSPTAVTLNGEVLPDLTGPWTLETWQQVLDEARALSIGGKITSVYVLSPQLLLQVPAAESGPCANLSFLRDLDGRFMSSSCNEQNLAESPAIDVKDRTAQQLADAAEATGLTINPSEGYLSVLWSAEGGTEHLKVEQGITEQTVPVG